MDHVYLCRYGPNEELRYSLRSLATFVPHDEIWIVGGWPEWLTGVRKLEHDVRGTKNQRTTLHLDLACLTEGISDPFLLWMDDIYAMQPMAEIPVLHNGPLRPRSGTTSWASGQRATFRWLERQEGLQPLMSYELHVPLLVHKEPMLEALRRLPEVNHRVPHKRTIYGNLAGLGGRYSADCKVMDRTQRVMGPWLSSADATFQSCVLPRLDLPEPSPYES